MSRLNGKLLFIGLFQFILCHNILTAQQFKDIVRVYTSTSGRYIEDVIMSGDQKYLVLSYGKYTTADGVYFNDKRVIDFDVDYSIYPNVHIMYVVKVTDQNEYIEHYKLVNYNGYLDDVKIIDDRIYSIQTHPDIGFFIGEYSRTSEEIIDTTFKFPDHQLISIDGYDIQDSILYITGNFNKSNYLYVGQDTMWYVNGELQNNAPAYFYTYDLSNDSIVYSNNFSNERDSPDVYGLEVDSDGTMFLQCHYTGDTYFMGDTLIYRGGADGVDVFIARISKEGELLSTNAFSSTSFFDSILDLKINSDGSYYVVSLSRSVGDFYIDDEVIDIKDFPNTSFRFISKFNSDGELVWHKTIKSESGLNYTKIIEYQKDNLVLNLSYYGMPQGIIIDEEVYPFHEEEECNVFITFNEADGEIEYVSDRMCNGKRVYVVQAQETTNATTIIMQYNENSAFINGEEYPNEYGFPAYQIVMNLDELTKTKEVVEDVVLLFPNPVSKNGTIYLEGVKGEVGLKYEIYNGQGLLIKGGEVTENQIALNITNSGLYFIRLTDAEGRLDRFEQVLIIN